MRSGNGSIEWLLPWAAYLAQYNDVAWHQLTRWYVNSHAFTYDRNNITSIEAFAPGRDWILDIDGATPHCVGPPYEAKHSESGIQPTTLKQ